MALSRITNPFLSSSGSNNTSITSPAANTIAFTTSTTEDMRIDSSGRVGIAATPSAWSNSWKVCQVGDASTSFTPGGSSYFSTNWLYDGTQKAIGSGSVLIYEQNYSVSGGNHIWYGSPTGTAGGTVTLVERMRINSSGQIGIGTTTPGCNVGFSIGTTSIVGQLAVSAHNPTNIGSIGIGISDGGGFSGVYVNNTHNGIYSSQEIRFLTAVGGASTATERMRISNTGALSAVIPSGSTLYPAHMVRSWVNFNGTGVVAIRSSGNVSSITDGGVGIYRVNFSTAMPDVNYSTTASVAGGGTVNSSTCAMLVNAISTTGQTQSTTYVDVFCYHPGNQAAQDNAWISVSVNR